MPHPGTAASLGPCVSSFPRRREMLGMLRGAHTVGSGRQTLTSHVVLFRVAIDISSRRLRKFHVKGPKLINSELQGSRSGWAENAATCLLPAWTGGPGCGAFACFFRLVCAHTGRVKQGPGCLRIPKGQDSLHHFPDQPVRYSRSQTVFIRF